MRIQFASDLHLNTWNGPRYKEDVSPEVKQRLKEKYFENILQPVAQTLVLCGDVGHPDSTTLRVFFKWCSKRWKTIFWIPGHHEMTDVWHIHTRSYDECLNKMRITVADYPNIQVLHRDKFITEDGFLFLACPLWSRLTSMSEEMSRSPLYKDITKHYEEDLKWLREEIRQAERPVVVATHYPPSYTLMDKDNLNEPLGVPYALETETLLQSPVVAWICGYTHKAFQIQRPWYNAEGRSGEVLLVANPRGYPDDLDTRFRRDAVLRLEENKRAQ